MITPQEEYNRLLYRIQDENAPDTVILLPSKERMFYIDLNSRTIQAPEFLSVDHDHRAETLYFVVDRFFDHVDLSNLTCVVQYVNARKEGYLYPVPYYDVDTLGGEFENKMIIPWNIGGNVTAYPGKVTFSFRFYHVDPLSLTPEYTDPDGVKHPPQGEVYFTYNLSTLPATSKVLYGFGTEILNEEYYQIAPNEVLNIYQRIDELSKRNTYWVDVD